MLKLVDLQQAICEKYGATPSYCNDGQILMYADTTRGLLPLNGMRVKTEDGSSGWYIWSGGHFTKEGDFFKPMYCSNIMPYAPVAEKFLALPVGYRFVIAGSTEKAWLDAELV
ncbi:MAG: hypothetical protein COA42_19370 [Alteromonadaceae bacterium]|nr:MAG: hypothetical protein COA42_19370 [Alteromonadaceae bacterium]